MGTVAIGRAPRLLLKAAVGAVAVAGVPGLALKAAEGVIGP